jgi:hypothetical protein
VGFSELTNGTVLYRVPLASEARGMRDKGDS